MVLPEIRTPGQSHLDQEFLQIEERFWTNKPTKLSGYPIHDPSGFLPDREGDKEAPTLDRDFVSRIWSIPVYPRVILASSIANLTIFSIPSFIDHLDAKSEKYGFRVNYRFSESSFKSDTAGVWTGFGRALLTDGEDLRFSIHSFHQSSRTQKHFKPDMTLPHGEFMGIPDCALTLNTYEIIRIGEELAAQAGVKISDEDRDTDYNHFRQILWDAGFWMPQDRAGMEEVALELDGLAQLNSSTLELSERAVRQTLVNSPEITGELVATILRPGARSIFTAICSQYGYFSAADRDPEPHPWQ